MKNPMTHIKNDRNIKANNGILLVEAVMVVVTLAVVVGIVTSSYLVVVRYWGAQRVRLELQQKARTAMSLVVNELTKAGSKLAVSTAPGQSICTIVTYTVPVVEDGRIKVEQTDTTQPPNIVWSTDNTFFLVNYPYPGTGKMLKSQQGANQKTVVGGIESVLFSTKCLTAPNCPSCTGTTLNPNEVKVDMVFKTKDPGKPNEPIYYTLSSIVNPRNSQFRVDPPPPGGGGGHGCLLKGTMVLMSDGQTKPIEQIQKGDRVMGFSKGTSVPAMVKKTFYHPQEKGYYILETAQGDVLQVTGNHPILNGRRYKKVETLKVGDTVHVFNNGQLRDAAVKKITKHSAPVDVYNIEVDGAHNYFAQGILVHNKVQMEQAEVY